MNLEAEKILYDPARHFKPGKHEWDPGSVKLFIHSIVEDLVHSIQQDCSWPTHPLDAESYGSAKPKWDAYAGASGVITAMQILRRYGYTEITFEQNLPTILQAYRLSHNSNWEAGLQLGELGILVPTYLANTAEREVEDRIIQCMEQMLDLPYFDITSGQTGMMHVALFLYHKTGDKRWCELYLKGASSLLKAWKLDENSSQWLWTSEVFGFSRRYYGACHGVAGNTSILLQGQEFFDRDVSNSILKRSIFTLNRAALITSNLVNWQLYDQQPSNKLLIQWCHGAAGVITSMAAIPTRTSTTDNLLEQLMQMGGNLVWKAGPLRKGSNICHGTAGNGYAFLYLYKRYANAHWLDKARAFAMMAIEQCREARKYYGQGRYSLWTGDAGLAIFLHHCLFPEEAAIPGLNVF
ncbi:LanC-like protein [Microbulbifer sp. GL-2]|uniref:lanthionine synthetase C family protein n=1 Tax=Microbulbifer sp. GL-2 TaxID=2591606 RepID=UPI0011630DEF|nr:LanC-like protein [Microbulbifer sp. GL-2]BBM03529.1 hypothetical protein GL2_36030 [Microbulbifer sp. GL-2]